MECLKGGAELWGRNQKECQIFYFWVLLIGDQSGNFGENLSAKKIHLIVSL